MYAISRVEIFSSCSHLWIIPQNICPCNLCCEGQNATSILYRFEHAYLMIESLLTWRMHTQQNTEKIETDWLNVTGLFWRAWVPNYAIPYHTVDLPIIAAATSTSSWWRSEWADCAISSVDKADTILGSTASHDPLPRIKPPSTTCRTWVRYGV